MNPSCDSQDIQVTNRRKTNDYERANLGLKAEHTNLRANNNLATVSIESIAVYGRGSKTSSRNLSQRDRNEKTIPDAAHATKRMVFMLAT